MAEPYAITLTPDLANPVGACGCFWASQPNKTMELGYWIAEPFWGKGLAVEACRAVLEYAFAGTAARADAGPRHRGQRRQRARAGETRLPLRGHTPPRCLRRGSYEDVMIYAVLRDEWPR